ncbi:transcriptional regulator of NAD metabolism [Oikeobacillus pervagus]|uniref:Transcriptional regulator of NAD metabolism n=1 Tax=Oikeobacillus pervagus TaxID=1325931 RepID=A0AAJ1T272_9BACI|nr:transcription repressor NadR [Oikeobacillus pervagus]MDQ0214569.1 transcriptional regulator of NAD metabolism [Oikeobacillus pervagus]
MAPGKKVLGEERRDFILKLLKKSHHPITGSEFSKKTNVSRQVIVNDITLLKARNEPIIATSQGYFYLSSSPQETIIERTVACIHSPEETENELNLLVDQGVMVKDVRVEHPIYGDLTASIMVSNRKEVDQFMQKVRETKASFLSQLTNGVHLHTLCAKDRVTLDEAVHALHENGYLFEEFE